MVEAGSRRVAIAGLLSPDYGGELLKIESPRKALAEALPAETEYDDLLVLAYLTQDQIKELLPHLPAGALVAVPAGVEVEAREDEAVVAVITAAVGARGASVVRFDREAVTGWSGAASNSMEACWMSRGRLRTWFRITASWRLGTLRRRRRVLCWSCRRRSDARLRWPALIRVARAMCAIAWRGTIRRMPGPGKRWSIAACNTMPSVSAVTRPGSVGRAGSLRPIAAMPR